MKRKAHKRSVAKGITLTPIQELILEVFASCDRATIKEMLIAADRSRIEDVTPIMREAGITEEQIVGLCNLMGEKLRKKMEAVGLLPESSVPTPPPTGADGEGEGRG